MESRKINFFQNFHGTFPPCRKREQNICKDRFGAKMILFAISQEPSKICIYVCMYACMYVCVCVCK